MNDNIIAKRIEYILEELLEGIGVNVKAYAAAAMVKASIS